MTTKELIPENLFEVVHGGNDKEISGVFCCDLLSLAMGRLPKGAAWVTVMGNVNTLAVAVLTGAACIILAEGAVLDAPARRRAEAENITVLCTERPVFEAAMSIQRLLEA